MLALLFDMNILWEQYILTKLQAAAQGKDIVVHDQREKAFWNGIAIRPDIIIEKKDRANKFSHFIIDTKWKNVSGSKPSTDDLRQIYVYNDYWSSTHAMLLYLGVNSNFNGFTPFNTFGNKTEHRRCGIAELSIFSESTNTLDENIGEKLLACFKDHQFVQNGQSVLKFSTKFKEKIDEMKSRHYKLKSVKVNFVLYWLKEGASQEIKIVLPELYFEKVIN